MKFLVRGLVRQCERVALASKTDIVVVSPRSVGDRNNMRLSKAERRVVEQFWKMGTCSVREILERVADDERVAYTRVQWIVYRFVDTDAMRRVVKCSEVI